MPWRSDTLELLPMLALDSGSVRLERHVHATDGLTMAEATSSASNGGGHSTDSRCRCTHVSHDELRADLVDWLCEIGAPDALWAVPQPHPGGLAGQRPVAFADPDAFAYWRLAGSPTSASFTSDTPGWRAADPARHGMVGHTGYVRFSFSTSLQTVTDHAGEVWRPVDAPVAELLRPLVNRSFMIRSGITHSAPTIVRICAHYGLEVTHVVVALVIAAAGGLRGSRDVPNWIRWHTTPSEMPGITQLAKTLNWIVNNRPELLEAFDPMIAIRLGDRWHGELLDLFEACAALAA